MTSDEHTAQREGGLSWPVFIGVAAALLLAGIAIGLTGFTLPAIPASLDTQPNSAAPSAFAQAAARFGSVLYLLLESAPVLAAIWCGAAGLGWPIRMLLERGRPPESTSVATPAASDHAPIGIVLQVGIGLGVLLLINYLLAVVGLISAVAAWAVPGIGVALLAVQVWKACPNGQVPVDALRPGVWTALLAAPMVGILLVGASCPPGTVWLTEAGGYDVMSYHLQLPREWLAQGQLTGFHHNVYSYLPSLVECQYTMISAMRGSVYAAIHTCQLFHISCALLAACATAQLARQWLPPAAAAFAGVLLIGVPWVLILGASAYNEMATLALGATALALLFHPAGTQLRTVATAGALLGIATLAKLTAGPNFVIPAILIVLLRLNVPRQLLPTVDLKRALLAAVVLAIAGGAVLTPYFARNFIGTGNPVFPFATSVFGTGHWTAGQAQAWNAAHQPDSLSPQAAVELMRHWLLNTGYGAVGGQATVRATENIAQFKYQFGFPTFWLIALAGLAALALRASAGESPERSSGSHAESPRRIALAMALILLVQIAFWIAMTHQQSRFLIFSIVPGAALGASALGWLYAIDAKKSARRFGLFGISAVLVCLLMTWLSARLFDRQTPEGAQPWMLVDTLLRESQFDNMQRPQAIPGDHPLNRLPRGSHVWLVADVSQLLYIRTPMTYNSAFDADALGDVYREAGPNPPDVLAELQKRDVDFIWVGWSELERLHNTYGYDKDVTHESIQSLIEVGLIPMSDGPRSPLYAVPRAGRGR